MGMGSLLIGLSLFGNLFGGYDGDCRQATEQASRTMQIVERQWPLRSSVDPVVGHVQRLGDRLTGIGAHGAAEPWSFHVVRNLEPLAFALGGGHVVVSDGLIAFLRNEGELAAVLAHEIAHQQLGHFCRDSSDTARRIQLGSVVQHFVLDIEIEADAAAVKRLAAAGYDPGAMYSVLECLAQRLVPSRDPDLEARRGALRRLAPSHRNADRPSPASFERLQRLVLDDIGEGGDRCR